MSKKTDCDSFEEFLKKHRLNYERHSDYHFQIQRIHNFYPSTGVYYNSDSGRKINCKINSKEDILSVIRGDDMICPECHEVECDDDCNFRKETITVDKKIKEMQDIKFGGRMAGTIEDIFKEWLKPDCQQMTIHSYHYTSEQVLNFAIYYHKLKISEYK